MWRVVCIGLSGPGYPYRAVDHGPLLVREERAQAIARWLERTGMYARVSVERVGGVQTASAVGPNALRDGMRSAT